MKRRYDYEQVEAMRLVGWTWEAIAAFVGAPSAGTLRSGYYRWSSRRGGPGGSTPEPQGVDGHHATEAQDRPTPSSDEHSIERTFTADEVSRIASLDDLLTFFRVDTTKYSVRDFRVNKWEQASGNKKTGITITPLYQVRANLVRNVEREVEAARKAVADLVADAAAHAPNYAPVTRRASLGDGDPTLFEVAIFDAHLGMLAWGEEVGVDYDTKIAVRDYTAAAEHLLSYATFYPTERILFIVGNDFLHVDGFAPTAKGSSRGGATSAGTAQDVDTRLAKMFTIARRAAVAAIDRARTVAPVDVLVVPGNHDSQQMYRMGEVLSAWYRHDREVNVLYGPAKRKFYGYGKNAFMFTHGEEYRRQRDSLPLIFATECPPDIWTASTHREIHTGHNHIAMGGRYVPTAELNETRQIRTRSLSGITPEDAWHYEEGYKHRRAASALAFRKSGGIAGLHEFNL